MANINKNIIMQAGAAVANATNKAAGLSASTPEPGSIISAIQLVNGGRTIGPDALAHFTESVRNKLLSLLVNMEPLQDLHGYDSPWPAGGGVNKFDKTTVTPTSSIGVAQNENGFVLTCLAVGSYRSITVDIPFTGHDGEVLYLKGGIVNSGSNNGYFSARFYNDSAEIGGVSARLELYPSRPTHQKTVPTGTTKIVCEIYVTSSASASVNDTTTFNNIILSLTDSAYSPYSNICPISGSTGLSVYVSPTQDPDDATTYAVDWTDEAGTVYGGTLDVVTGVLTVDRAIVDLGTLTWNYNASWGGYPAFYCSDAPTGIKTPSVVAGELMGALCSQYIEVTRNYLFSHNETAFCVPNDGKISIRDTRYTSASDFQSAMNGVQLCYTLATPLTYQLTPQDIITLVGDNYIWSDSGDVTITE